MIVTYCRFGSSAKNKINHCASKINLQHLQITHTQKRHVLGDRRWSQAEQQQQYTNKRRIAAVRAIEETRAIRAKRLRARGSIAMLERCTTTSCEITRTSTSNNKKNSATNCVVSQSAGSAPKRRKQKPNEFCTPNAS